MTMLDAFEEAFNLDQTNSTGNSKREVPNNIWLEMNDTTTRKLHKV